MELRLISLFGWMTMILAAWAISYNRKLFPWRTVVWGIGLQFVLAVLILKTPGGKVLFEFAG
jgi:CNT family concentrative nucleoside transporter